MWRNGAAGLVVLLFLGGCAAAEISEIQIPVPPNLDVLGFSQVLVAGFVPDGSDQIDLNEEPARFLRTQLRSTTASPRVIEPEPLQLADMSRPNGRRVQIFGAAFRPSDGNRPQDSQSDDAVFTNVTF